jgi:hypothetical protein
MTKINRHTGNLTPFAKHASGVERTVFGGVIISDALDDNLTALFGEGWADVTNPTLWPKLRDFNSTMFTATQLIAYLMQTGIPEYHDQQEYFTGSMCSSGGIIYVSQDDNNTDELLTDPLFWKKLTDIPENSITTFELAINAIQTLNVADNAITLDKHAHGTPNSSVEFNDSGVPVEVGGKFGTAQTLVNKTNIRFAGLTYTNETTRPIHILIDRNSNTPTEFYINDTVIATISDPTGDESSFFTAMIPSLFTYGVQTGTTFDLWHEITSNLTT